MRTFLQLLNEQFFLTEKVFMAMDNQGEYVEIWKNPTKQELSRLGSSQQSYYNPSWGKTFRYLGGLMTPSNLFVWDRDLAEHHDIMKKMTTLPKNFFAIYLYFFPATDTVAIQNSSFSTPYAVTQKFQGHVGGSDILAAAKKHPVLKKLPHIESI